MPYKVTHIAMREIDPENAEQLAALGRPMSAAEHVSQHTASSLPEMVEPEMANKDYLTWAQKAIHSTYPDAHFRYAIIDLELTPTHPDGKQLTLPAMLVSLFDYNGKTYAGPMVTGYVASLLDAKGEGHPPQAINIAQTDAHIFTAAEQQRLCEESIRALTQCKGIDGALIAVPNSRLPQQVNGNTTAPLLTKGGFFHLMVGGNVLDQHKPYALEDYTLPQKTRIDPFRTSSFTALVTKEKGNQYTLFSHLGERTNDLLGDEHFCNLCLAIRNLGPEYGKQQPDRMKGTQYTPDKMKNLVTELLNNSGQRPPSPMGRE